MMFVVQLVPWRAAAHPFERGMVNPPKETQTQLRKSRTSCFAIAGFGLAWFCLERSRHLDCNADAIRDLRTFQNVLPSRICAEGFLGHHDHVARPHFRSFYSAGEHPSRAAHNRAIRSYHEYVLLIRDIIGAASLVQIPAGRFAGLISNGG